MTIFDRRVAKLEREHVGPVVDLSLPNGRLNPHAVSWSRRPHIRANLRGWGRRKRFEYWAITTPECVLGFSLSHADYRAGFAAFFLNLSTLESVTDGEAHWLPGRVDLPETSGDAAMRRTGTAVTVSIEPNARGTLLEFRGKRIAASIQVIEPEGHESMGVVVPWTSRRFQYTRKDNCLRCEGWIEVDGVRTEVSANTAWAALDHGRGKWPYEIVWNWACGAGISGGHEIGIQLGAKWTDGTPSTENSIRIDGHIEKISADVEWEYDASDFMKPWRFRGPQVDLRFTPVYNRHSRFDRKIILSREDQAFGWWDGTVTSTDGSEYPVTGIFGWAEEVHRRW